MKDRGNSNLGDEIKNTVEEALNKKNFNKLNRNIGNFVYSALDEVKSSIQGSRRTYRTSQIKTNNKNLVDRKKLFVPVGQVSSLLLTIFGGIGTSLTGISVFVLLVLGFLPGSREIFNTIALAISPFLLISIFLLAKGYRGRKILKRFQKYKLELKEENFILIEDLALATNQRKKSVERDLRTMIQRGMFPQGHIDDEKMYFILEDEIYDQYLQLKKNMGKKNLEKVREKKKEKNSKDDHLDPEVRKSINEGREFISKIRESNKVIPGEEISIKLNRLEEVTGKIFDYVEIHPEKLNEIKKFTEYFLPTTLKLVQAYKKLEYQSIEGENISNSKKEIEETMDTINLAFENLLDDLFQDLAMDISTDISVLETLFAQEGLTESDMKINRRR